MKLAESTKRTIPRLLLAWFDRHQRDLPWRHSRDPYAIWVSEIMLQQTRVEAVIPYYERWLQKFPTVELLARAPAQTVLKAWEGLGYYSRVRNLHLAAKKIVRERGGHFPRTSMELRSLPGVGRYTAGAVASIAFGERVAVVDGNVARVLSRLFAIRRDVRTAATQQQLWVLAEALVPRTRTGDFNQALMELGATVCVPRVPCCNRCPLARLCKARHRGLQDHLPIRHSASAESVTRLAAIVRHNGKIFLAQRPGSGRLAGFWELPSVGDTNEAALRRVLRKQFGLRISTLQFRSQSKYAVTKFSVTLQLFDATLVSDVRDAKGQWVGWRDLRRLMLPAADRQVLAELQL